MNNQKHTTDLDAEEQETVFGPDANFNGNIVTELDVRVFGSFDGSISCRKLSVEDGGRVNGDVDAETLSNAGHVSGDVTATNVFVASTGSLEGKFNAHQYGIELGASIKKAEMDSPDDIATSVSNPSSRRYPRVVVPHGSGKRQSSDHQASRASGEAPFVHSDRSE